jgi:hypothetical protein
VGFVRPPAEHAGPVLWIRSRLRAIVIQILRPQQSRESILLDAGDDVPHLTTLVAVTSLMVASILGFSRQYRRAAFIQRCLFKHVRRYLIVMEALSLQLRFRGGVPRLRAYWRSLTTPVMEFFRHPITEELLADVTISQRD